MLDDPANAPVLGMLDGTGALPSLDDSSFIGELDPRLAAPFLDGFAQSTSLVILVAAAILAVGFASSFLLPDIPLRQVSGIQSRIDADLLAAQEVSARSGAPGKGDRPGTGVGSPDSPQPQTRP